MGALLDTFQFKKKKRKIGKIENKCGDEEKGKREESLARKESKNKNKLLLFRSANNS
jgi:hypothetical protein